MAEAGQVTTVSCLLIALSLRCVSFPGCPSSSVFGQSELPGYHRSVGNSLSTDGGLSQPADRCSRIIEQRELQPDISICQSVQPTTGTTTTSTGSSWIRRIVHPVVCFKRVSTVVRNQRFTRSCCCHLRSGLRLCTQLRRDSSCKRESIPESALALSSRLSGSDARTEPWWPASSSYHWSTECLAMMCLGPRTRMYCTK